MYTLLNGSSKVNKSNSKYFLNYIAEYLDEYKIYDLKTDNFNDIIDNIKKSNSIILAFPLYVDSPNSITLKFLDYIYDNLDLEQIPVYVIINCGFLEGEHNILASNIIKNWCQKTNSIYSGGLLIGAGEIIGKEKYKMISKDALNELRNLSIKISRRKIYPDMITTMDILNKKSFCFLANRSWNRKAKINDLSIREIKKML